MNVFFTNKNSISNKIVLNNQNAIDYIKNNTIVTVFQVLGNIEVVLLNADYYGDFIKREVSDESKKFVGSLYVEKKGKNSIKLCTDKLTKLIDKRLKSKDISDEESKILIDDTSKKVLELLSC